MTIEFYGTKSQYGAFSNFARYPVNIDGVIWPTSEHYYQAQKYAGQPREEAIRQATSPRDAKNMGNSHQHPPRADWGTVKEEVMRKVLLAKFTQYPDLRDLLLSTGDERIVEHTTNDSYWGDGGDGSGLNRLGELLMALRTELSKFCTSAVDND